MAGRLPNELLVLKCPLSATCLLTAREGLVLSRIPGKQTSGPCGPAPM